VLQFQTNTKVITIDINEQLHNSFFRGNIANCIMQLASFVTFTHLFISRESALDQLIKLIPLQVEIARKVIMGNVNKYWFNRP
jgi:hypothetical protein